MAEYRGISDCGDRAVGNPQMVGVQDLTIAEQQVQHTIADVARMAGVTSRTLRHYDAIGLLRPARVAGNGYRWYGRAELLRLQRILLLRQLRLPLRQIHQLLDGTTDELASLQRHREDLIAERDRLDQIIHTVDRTIADLAGTQDMTDEEFFSGLARGQESLRQDLRTRYGEKVDEHFASSQQSTAKWTRADHEQAAEQGRQLLRLLSQSRKLGHAPGDDTVLDLISWTTPTSPPWSPRSTPSFHPGFPRLSGPTRPSGWAIGPRLDRHVDHTHRLLTAPRGSTWILIVSAVPTRSRASTAWSSGYRSVTRSVSGRSELARA